MSGYATFSDSELISLLREGNEHAYTEIYKRYFNLIFIHAYKKLRDEDQAKDIVQELFVNLWEKRDKIPFVNNPAGYLITSVKNTILNFFEHQNVESKYIISLKEYANNGNIANTDYYLREKQLLLYIDLAINQLPNKMRKAFELSRKENLSNREIAKKLNTTESNVSKHIHGAVKILRAKLSMVFFATF